MAEPAALLICVSRQESQAQTRRLLSQPACRRSTVRLRPAARRGVSCTFALPSPASSGQCDRCSQAVFAVADGGRKRREVDTGPQTEHGPRPPARPDRKSDPPI